MKTFSIPSLPRAVMALLGAGCALSLLAVPVTAQSDQLVAPGAVWKYLDDGSNQGTGWRASSFDDSSWAQGPSQLGYGDGDENTVVSFGSNSSDKHITTYFRHSFVVPDASVYQALTLRLLRDDGAVAYLNGVELVRSNMTSGGFNFDTVALSTVSGSQEDTYYPKDDIASGLLSGTNVLAVEIHQRTNTSSDISFNAELIAHQEPILSRGPYLQKGTDTSVTVRWRTYPASDSWVWYGTSIGNLSSVISDPALVSDHEIEISGLAPGTTYYYAIGEGGVPTVGDDAEHFFVTSPIPGTVQPLRVWVLGDSGTADSSARAVRNAYTSYTGTTHTNLWLMLGDNAYTSGTDDEYEAAVFDMYPEMLRKSVLWPTRGNHETSSSTYYGIFSMTTGGEAGGLPSGSEAYYSFDYANVHFICLDSQGSNLSTGGAMATWLQADLAATNQDWVIAFWHHPPYTKGSHNSNTESTLITMRQNFLPILEAGGVDLVLCGHSHSYERSFLLDGHYGLGGTLTADMVLDGGSGQEENDGAYNKSSGGNRGAVYTVAGSSGKTGGGLLNHPAMFTSLNVLGSVVLDINGGRLDATFLRTNGSVGDHWTFLSDSFTGAYCVASPTSEGCAVQMSATGVPSVTDPTPYFLDASGAPNDKFGLLFYGYTPNNVPFYNGRLCIKAPLTRTTIQNSGSGPLPCLGSFSLDFNARIQSGIDGGLVPGATVYSQYWFRDVVGTAGLSDGYQFVIQP